MTEMQTNLKNFPSLFKKKYNLANRSDLEKGLSAAGHIEKILITLDSETDTKDITAVAKGSDALEKKKAILNGDLFSDCMAKAEQP